MRDEAALRSRLPVVRRKAEGGEEHVVKMEKALQDLTAQVMALRGEQMRTRATPEEGGTGLTAEMALTIATSCSTKYSVSGSCPGSRM